MKMRGLYKLFLAIAISFLSTKGFAMDDVYIAPHFGQYNIELHQMDPEKNGGIIDAHGTLTYELNKDCLGWIAKTSIFLDFILDDGTTKTLISNLSSYESFDGWEYTFAHETYNESENPNIHTGHVVFSLKDNHATVNFTKPEQEPAIQLPMSTLFPVALYKNIIRAANQRIHNFNAPYFDGATPTELFKTSIFITDMDDGNTDNITGDIYLLENQRTIESSSAFFGEDFSFTPTFETRMKIFNNGIMQEMIQTLGSVDVKMTLQEIQSISPKACSPIAE